MMQRVINAPARYVQGAGAILELEQHYREMGKSKGIFILADRFAAQNFSADIAVSFEVANTPYRIQILLEPCSMAAVRRFLPQTQGFDMIMAVGGGTVIDTAKLLGKEADLPVMVVPTSAAMDGACSGVAVCYTEEGAYESYIKLPKNPDLVVVDTRIIAKAPPRLLVAGIGDALSTYFEAAACAKSGTLTPSGGLQSRAGAAMAHLCLDTILHQGVAAKAACEIKTVTDALENVIEANVYLSCFGFENGGLAFAHALQNGLNTITAIDSKSMHGEKVAFCTLVQLALEANRADGSLELLQQVGKFCKEIGLPTNLEELGYEDITDEQLKEAAAFCLQEGQGGKNMPFEITVQNIVSAVCTVDLMFS
ncbi:MAG: glycerol dehydrogenase [Oscillospiraceae bacterium]|nr:glycerol dehydrogenase [Oscillospiraceae bacterium]